MQKSKMARVALSPQQRRLWEDTLGVLSWVAPGFVHVIYTMLNNTGDDDVALFTEDMEFAAATDGYQLIFKPSLFFKLTLMERTFAVLHEVMHEILDHCRMGYHYRKLEKITLDGRTLPYAPMFANVVQDLVINAILIVSKMGTFNKGWLHDPDLKADETTWIELYFRLWKDCNGGRGGKGGLKPPTYTGPGKQFDEHLDPHASQGIDPHEAPERNAAAWEIATNAAMEIQRAQGKLPAALEMFFTSVLKPKVDWTEHVKGLIHRITGSGAYDWRRLDRRLIARGIGAPGITGHGAGLIVVGGDTSMSIFHDKELVQGFVNEMAGILEDVQPEVVHSVWCDTEVKRVDVLHNVDDLRRVIATIPGGGGTSFIPVFEYIEQNDLRPDALIYLTDLEGAFPDHEPDYPVIWGSINPDGKAPFGTIVRIPKGD